MKSDVSDSGQWPQPPGLTPAELRELSRRLGLPLSARWRTLVAHRGRSVWRVDCAQDRFVVRVFRRGDRHGAMHEQNAMTAARAAGLPVPAVRTVAQFEERSVLLIDWCHGRSLQEELYSRPWNAHRLGRLFGEQQARLHEARAERFCKRNWIEFFGGVDEAMHERLVRADRSPCLIHLDFYPGNVEVENGTISGILDWTNARIGDRRADLARTWTLLNLVFRSGRRRPLRRWAEIQFAQGWRDAYVRKAGRQADMPLFQAWALEGLIRVGLASEVGGDLDGLTQMARTYRAQAGLPASPLPSGSLAT